MKKAILIATVLLSAQAATAAHAEEGQLTVLLNGGPAPNAFEIQLSADGRTYEITSNASLEVGGSVCWHPDGNALQLLCEAPAIGGFEVNGEGGDDRVEVNANVRIPVTLSGGPGNDRLTGGAGNDRLLGGSGFDRLLGGPGDDQISGGPGPDVLNGELGDDTISGEGGEDTVIGGPGDDHLSGGPGHDRLFGGPGEDWLNGGPEHDALYGGPGDDRYVDGLSDKIFSGPGRDVAVPGGVVP
jgi:Ca2+-binding RTX toxin-like protein